jgi:hypothetical protein
MNSLSIPGLVLDEAADVLGDLADWLRAMPYCPRCMSLRGCSHEAGCSLGRVLRLRCLLGSGDEKRRDEELTALRRERGCAVTPAGDGAPLLIEPVTPSAGEAGAR